MNEGELKPSDELDVGEDWRTGEAGEEGGVGGKRRVVRSRRMQEYLHQQCRAPPQKLRPCPVPGCPKLFSSAPGLRYHVRTHSPDTASFHCQRCSKQFKSHNGLKYHQQKRKCLDAPSSLDTGDEDLHRSPSPTVEAADSDSQAALLRLSSSDRDETDSMHTWCPEPLPLELVPRSPPLDKASVNLPLDWAPKVQPPETITHGWPEPRHRKMESRRKRLEQQLRLAAQTGADRGAELTLEADKGEESTFGRGTHVELSSKPDRGMKSTLGSDKGAESTLRPDMGVESTLIPDKGMESTAVSDRWVESTVGSDSGVELTVRPVRWVESTVGSDRWVESTVVGTDCGVELTLRPGKRAGSTVGSDRRAESTVVGTDCGVELTLRPDKRAGSAVGSDRRAESNPGPPPAQRLRPLDSAGSREEERLLEFATIATGPQSPLVSRTVDWDKVRFPGSEDGGQASMGIDAVASVQPLSVVPSAVTVPTTSTTHSVRRRGEARAVDPFPASPKDLDRPPSPCSSFWPAAVWQCFMTDTQVQLDGGETSCWRTVQSCVLSRLQGRGPSLPEDLRQPVALRLLWRRAGEEGEMELGFEAQSSRQSRLTARCCSHHPFFVRDKGWSSCNTVVTKDVYGLPSSCLEVGDVCLPMSNPTSAAKAKHPEGSEVNSLEISSVKLLSELAKKRSQEGSTDRQTLSVSPSGRQQTPSAKRPMNAFFLWSQRMRPELIRKFPRTNNRDISSMLSKAWRKLADSEKRQLQSEARTKAEIQRQRNPDCWKRKHARAHLP